MNIKSIYRIIDEYNDAAFEACKNSLYDKLNFFIMDREDIRRVDLKEKLAAFFDAYKFTIYKEDGIGSTFALLAFDILNEYVSVDSGSREKKYLDKAYDYSLSLRGKKMTEDRQIATLENFIMIYLSFLHKYKEIKKGKTIMKSEDDKEKPFLKLKDVAFKTSFNDSIETIGYIYDKISKYHWEEERLIIQNKTHIHELTPEERRFLYIISTLIAFRIFQFEGEI